MIDLVIEAPGRVALRRAGGTRPGLRPGEVLVEVERVGLCGSDYALYEGSYGGPRRYPIRFGHEWSGTVVQAPRGSRLREGQIVTGDCSRWCGSCDLCAVDKNLCREVEKFGITCDGFSTRWRAVQERYLYPDTRGLGHDLLALAEIFAVALHGLRKAPAAAAGGEALVIGAGPLGLAACLLLRHALGARQIHVVEIDERKVAAVRERFPELHFLEPPSPELRERPLSYAEISASARYPLVLECSGSAAGLDTGLLLAAPAGCVVCFGMGGRGAVRTDLLVSKSVTLRGSIGGTGEFPDVLELFARHGGAAARLITHRFPAHRVREAFEGARREPSRIKVQIELGDS